MTRRWPDTLPYPSWPEYQIEGQQTERRSDMESGPAKVRQTTGVRTDIVSPEWRMNDAQKWAFDAWYYGLPVSAFGSDSLTGWTLQGATAAVAPVLGPMGEPVDALVEDASLLSHGAWRVTEIVPAGTTALVFASLLPLARSRVYVDVLGRDLIPRWVIADLAAGVIEASSGIVSATLLPRGNGWRRLEMQAAVGVGGAAPQMRVYALPSTGIAFDYPGGSVPALALAELQMRQAVTGRNLFIPAAADGKALGAARTKAWFRTELAFGGGLTACEARFVSQYAAKPLQGLRWQVKGALEVRDV